MVVPKQIKIVAALYAFFVLVLVIESITDDNEYYPILKGISSIGFCTLAFMSYHFSNGHEKTYSGLVLTAFVFMCIADVVIEFADLLVPAIGCFAIGHVLLIVAFLRYLRFSPMTIVVSIIWIAFSILVITRDIFDFGDYAPFVFIYATIISIMVGIACCFLCNHRRGWFVYCIVIGAILFFVSDFVLMFNMFYAEPSDSITLINLITYYLGEGLLAVSFLGSRPVKM